MNEKQATLKDLLLAPFMGLAYAIFLPAAGIVMTMAVIGKWSGQKVSNFLYKGASFNWRPSEAYLLGKKTKRKKI